MRRLVRTWLRVLALHAVGMGLVVVTLAAVNMHAAETWTVDPHAHRHVPATEWVPAP